ncbi:MAG: sigma-54 dependent transcriptional regulator [Gallionella sp.]|nr:sigma-54 dependent transcriptional regulator [Gallionella sp.]
MNASLPSLMIVDDAPLIREGMSISFGNDFDIIQADSRLAAIQPHPPYLALIDLGQPPLPHHSDEGFHLITELLTHSPNMRIFTLSRQDEESHAHSLGIANLIAKPCAPEKIKAHLYNALRMQNNERDNENQDDQPFGIIGQSAAIQTLRNQIAMSAAISFPVLIEGESGCGKELVANALQSLRGNSGSTYKALNCAAISPTLIEPTLFGYCKGAFTGASAAQAGFFEEANDGTLFLDEVGELPLELQAKLLRVLENGEYQRVGETQTRKSRARIIAATNRNLRAAVKDGSFRSDLYHRLSVFSITAPPLREMGQDKLVLLNHFRSHYAKQLNKPSFELHAEAFLAWEQYAFPGNTRELRNIVIRLAIKYAGKTVTAEQLRDEFDPHATELDLTPSSPPPQALLAQGTFDLNQFLSEQESIYTNTALTMTDNNISEAAKLLGLNRTTLRSRIEARARYKKPG